jgi:hypothetical protein
MESVLSFLGYHRLIAKRVRLQRYMTHLNRSATGEPFPKKRMMLMSVFTLEIVRHCEAPVIADVLSLPDERAIFCRAEAWLSDERAIWCRAEALALRIENGGSAFIRVKNAEDATVVLTNVTTALASIEKCSCVACPIKSEWERRISAGASRRN